MRNFLFLSAAEPLASQVADELSENAEQTKSAIEKFFDHFSLPKLVSAAILLVICIICIKIILRATEKMLKSSKLDKSCHAFLRSSIKIVLVFLAIMLLAGTLGVDTSSLLAILSVAGLAVSLSIQDSLSKMMKAGTMLMVAHRLSTVQHADNIIVMSHGEIVEQGSHNELLLKKGRYYRLYMLQYDKNRLKAQNA